MTVICAVHSLLALASTLFKCAQYLLHDTNFEALLYTALHCIACMHTLQAHAQECIELQWAASLKRDTVPPWGILPYAQQDHYYPHKGNATLQNC
jgi:hypothetical protein